MIDLIGPRIKPGVALADSQAFSILPSRQILSRLCSA
jgi:hypothetical protein